MFFYLSKILWFLFNPFNLMLFFYFMKIIIKSFVILISTIFLLFCSLLVFDMADYDSSYVNRKSLVFDVKNLNSRFSHRTIFFLRNTFIKVYTTVSKKYQKRWDIEDEDERIKYPEYKIIPSKKTNFSKSISNDNDY